jgi:uncharacterized membrane protein
MGTILSKSGRGCDDQLMEQTKTIEIAASPERVWEVLSDVEYWPEWTESVTFARRLEDGPLRPGSRTRLKQPRLPEAEWVVTELEPGRSFTWVSTGPARNTARHDIEALPGGGSRVRLGFESAGLLGALVGRLYGGMIKRYIGMEAEGLKRRAESGASGVEGSRDA